MGAGSGGDAGQLTRSSGSSSASLPYVVTVDSALALAQLLQPSLAFCYSYNKMLLVVAAITFSFIVSFIASFIALVIAPLGLGESNMNKGTEMNPVPYQCKPSGPEH